MGLHGIDAVVATTHTAVAARSAGQRPRRDPGRRRRAGWGALATLVLLLVANSPGRAAAVASGPGAWSPTGSMQQGRASHTATLLPNGQVLAAGGCCSPELTSLASAELCTP